ncbi:MAG: phosphoribosylanthranilate isomerase [Candidatus Krumholzibacteria bacterium]|nr:phosphoribosylanthranilate isomerase [Candidatus Krumholzibacteria bacterium]
MSRARVKICGIMTPEDARMAYAAGADYLGLIFTDSARQVDAARARKIREAVPDVKLVGVFRDAPAEEVAATVRHSGVDLVQLHGRETPGYCARVLLLAGRPVIKAFALNGRAFPDTSGLAAYESASFILFDTDKNGGGPAIPEDVAARIWPEAARRRRQGFRIFLAGALDPQNVREAVAVTSAFCVDVCRGVESAPGIKDAALVQRFIAEAKRH